MTKRIVLSCEEIYGRVVKRLESASYYYYTEPFKEKVFFFPILGFYEKFITGQVCEIVLAPDTVDPERMHMISFKTYKQEELTKKRSFNGSTW